ncbi:efflux RND transporter periplasmic adaptor subunit [Seongchinamella sediminis]|uniref:Efflux RND transporter periplasmic adaptor subunit n=2 Tax=Seongchinamella sediminis TaxID=2283635 RepID=A0A3L7E188_9GAMM|nr:efflux RND transporter periplasmic adaptor subunit [Seongchinamella sediminis]
MGLVLIVTTTALAAGCSREEPEPPPPVSRPVKLYTVGGGSNAAIRTFPGRVDATQRAELAFRVSGQLQELLVKEGDLVEKRQVLARLDPTDYEIVLEDRQANYDNAKRNFERGKELIVDGNISRLDYDRMEANYRTASAALTAAQQDLEYTVLTAPFRGRIARRAVENFEEVMARQTVIWLQNITELDVIIDLPESVVRSVRGQARQEGNLRSGETAGTVVAYASFEGRSERRFALKPKELATKADEQTQTFRTTFTMEAPTDFNVLPGMTANVTIDLTRVVDKESVKWVPVRAVQADSGLQPRVWVLDPESMTVSSQPVGIGRMSGRSIQVLSGLDGGEEIVSVGAPYLAEGMRVTRMPLTEQAVPRDGEPL